MPDATTYAYAEGLPMSKPILDALRTRRDLKESVLHTVLELAHRASIYGVARVSYSYLAMKCHCSKRTVMRHIQTLIDLKILRKTVLWIKNNFCEVNTYVFTISWHKTPEHVSNGDKMASEFPHQEEREKFGSLHEQRRALELGLAKLTPGSYAYRASLGLNP
jgi:hypothetical protein